MPTVRVWQCPTKSTLRSRTNSPGARRSEKLDATNIAAEQLAQPDVQKSGARRFARTAVGACRETRRGKPFLICRGLTLRGTKPLYATSGLCPRTAGSGTGVCGRETLSPSMTASSSWPGSVPDTEYSISRLVSASQPLLRRGEWDRVAWLWRLTCLQFCLPWLVKKPYGWNCATSRSGKWTPRGLTCRRMLSTLLSVGGP